MVYVGIYRSSSELVLNVQYFVDVEVALGQGGFRLHMEMERGGLRRREGSILSSNCLRRPEAALKREFLTSVMWTLAALAFVVVFFLWKKLMIDSLLFFDRSPCKPLYAFSILLPNEAWLLF